MTHISSAIRAILAREDESESWLAALTGVPQPTLNRLSQHRISPDTLRALCTKPPSHYGLEILISHLRDEIDRSGRLQSEVQIEAADVRMDDLALLATEAQTNPDLRAMIHDMANLVRRYQQAQPEQEQLMHAAEAPAPYGKQLVARVRTDFDRKVTEVSPEFIKLCGHPSEEIIGHNLSEVVQGPGTEPDAVAKLRAALAKRKSVEVEITNYHKNGQPYKISLAIKPTPEGFEGEARLVP